MRVVDFVIKELRQMRRDRRLIMMVALMPMLQLVLYGYAVSTDIRHLKTVICDLDGSSQSRDIVRSIQASPEYFDIEGYAMTVKEAQADLDSGQAQVVVVVPARYSRDISSRQPATLQVLLDGSDPNAGTIAGGYIGKIVTAQAQAILLQRKD